MPRTITRAEQIAENQLSVNDSPLVGVENFDIVRYDGENYVPAIADTQLNADVFGLALDVTGSIGTVIVAGIIDGFSNLTPGSIYYLSQAQAGKITATEPPSGLKVALGVAITDTIFHMYHIGIVSHSSSTTSGTVSGTGVANQVAFWTDVTEISGSTDFTWNNTTLSITGGDASNAVLNVVPAANGRTVASFRNAAGSDIVSITSSAAGNGGLSIFRGATEVFKFNTETTESLLKVSDTSNRPAIIDMTVWGDSTGPGTIGNSFIRFNSNFCEFPSGLNWSGARQAFINMVSADAGSSVMSGGVNGESFRRFRMTTSGQMLIGGGTSAATVWMERSSATLINFSGYTFRVTNTTNSTSPTSGALTVAGGFGVALNTRLGGNLAFSTGVSISSILDEDNMASNSATALATQQSIKAYVDGIDKVTGSGVADQVAFWNGTKTLSGSTNFTWSSDTLNLGAGSFRFTAGVAVSSILDEDDMISDSATALATQQSIRAYVSSSVITDHGGLSGLGDDDHSQYLLLAGRTGQTITDVITIDGGTDAVNQVIPLYITGEANGTGGNGRVKVDIRNTGSTTQSTSLLLGSSATTAWEFGTNWVGADDDFYIWSENLNNGQPTDPYGLVLHLTAAGSVKAAQLTDSTSPTTGALLSAGGAGIAKSLYIGENLGFDSGVAVQEILDQDDMASDSATALATQQSIKAYVDGKTTNMVDGIGEAGRVAFWSDENTITYHQNLSWNNTTLSITSGVESTDEFDGTLVVTGGIGISGKVNTGGNITASADGSNAVDPRTIGFMDMSAEASGVIMREVWTGVGGQLISDIPLSTEPDIVDFMTSFEAPTDWADNYGTRMSGYLIPPEDDDYTFWIATDDAGELWLSTDENPENAVMIANVVGWAGTRQWDSQANQESIPISLVGGNKYYIYALQKEGAGGDNLSVAWSSSTITRDVIAGTYLVPAGGTSAARFQFGNTGTGIQYASGAQMNIHSYDSIVIQGARSDVSFPSFIPVGGDAQVIIHSTRDDKDILAVKARVGQTGHLQKWIGPSDEDYAHVDVDGNIISLAITTSTSSTTGAIVSIGGIGVGENLYVGNKFSFDSGVYATEISDDITMSDDSHEKLVTQYAAKGYADGPHAATQDPTGFESPDSVTVSYDPIARTVTVTQPGGIVIWLNGIRYSYPSYTSPVHNSATGLYYLSMIDETGPSWSTSQWSFSVVQIAYVYYSPTIKFCLRECHGLMPWQVHEEFHRTVGAYRRSGGGLTAGTYAVQPASPNNADNTPGFEQAFVADEDLATTIAAWPQGTYTNFWLTGTGTANMTTTSLFPFNVGAVYPMYYPYSGGSFIPTEMGSAVFFNVYQMLIPVTSDTESQKYRMVMVQPEYTYYTLAAAQSEDYRSLSTGEFSGLVAESVVFTRITYYTKNNYSSTGRVRIEAVSYIVGTGASQVAVAAVTPSSHTTLSDRDVANQHPASAISILTPTGNLLGATDLQVAVTAIDGLNALRAIDKAISYDGNGRISVVTDSRGTKTMGYDGAGKLVSITGTGIYQSKTLTYTGDNLTGITVS
jgi:YD repeat-containing protein